MLVTSDGLGIDLPGAVTDAAISFAVVKQEWTPHVEQRLLGWVSSAAALSAHPLSVWLGSLLYDRGGVQDPLTR